MNASWSPLPKKSAICTAASLALLIAAAFMRSDSGSVSRGSSQTMPVRATFSTSGEIFTGLSSESDGLSSIILTIDAIGTCFDEFFSHSTVRVPRSTMIPEVAPRLPGTSFSEKSPVFASA